jgi:uncharacterized GH25 family protein
MRHASRWAAVVLGVAALGVWAIPSRGADATTQPSSDTQAGTGTITGTVMKDGKPLANARVGLLDRAQVQNRVKNGKNANQGNADQTNTDKSNSSDVPAGAKVDDKQDRPKPTAMTTTDSDGKFTINDVKPGEYVVIAGAKGEGRGRARIGVQAGTTATVEISVSGDGGGKVGGKKAGKANTAT